MQKLLQDVPIGKNLQRLRKLRGISQYDMVIKLELLGRTMTRSNYANIEQGRGNIFVSDLMLFKEIFDVSYEEFFKNLSSESDKSSND